jgi:hypothetical protein
MSIYTHIKRPQKSWNVQLFIFRGAKKEAKGLNCYPDPATANGDTLYF